MIAIRKIHPPIILFDFDGVIISTRGPRLALLSLLKKPFYKWNREALKNLTTYDLIRRFERSDSESIRQSIKKLYGSFRDVLPHPVRRALFLMKFGSIFRKWERLYSDFFPGTVDVLKRLKNAGIIMGICTNSEGKRLPYWLKRKGCSDCITAWVSRDDKDQLGLKPSPRPLLGLLVKIKRKCRLGRIDRNKVFFCGDNPTDIESAKKAGIRSIAFLSGHGTEEELKTCKPDYLISSIKELPNIPEIAAYIEENSGLSVGK